MPSKALGEMYTSMTPERPGHRWDSKLLLCIFLAESNNVSWYLTNHFLTNVTARHLLSLFLLEDACGNLVLKNFAFQTSHFPCFALKETDGEKPQGGKGNKTQNTKFQVLPSHLQKSTNGI